MAGADASTEAALAETLAAAGLPYLDGGPAPMPNAEAVAAAVLDRTGRVVVASPAFAALQAEGRVDPAALAEAARGASAVTVQGLAAGEGAGNDTTLFACAPAAQAAAWRLPPRVREAAAAQPGHVVVLTSQSPATPPLEAACRAYGLSGLQTRVALETIRLGNVRDAAQALDVAYATAREALAEAMRRVHAPRLPALVHRLTSLAFGVMPDEEPAAALADLWALTPRQAAIAGLVAQGLSRGGAAQALSLGEAVVRKELETVHLLLQVRTGAQLARRLAEAQALAWLTRATSGDLGFVSTAAEPLQFVHRPDGGRIAVSDYGPASGRPVLVVHSSMTTRIVSRALLRALQAAGFRPISIDRPGFGLTDEHPGQRPGAHDPYATAAADALRVLDHLKIRRVDLAARGGAQFVLALGRAAPERLGRVVLTNPAPHTARDDRNVGPLGVIKEAFRRNPAMIHLAATVFIRQSSYERLAEFMRRSMAGSPPDAAACRDPELVRDYFHTTRTFGVGRLAGYINEQTDFAQGSEPPPLAGAHDWRVVVAGHDVLHDPAHVTAYWRRVLPDAAFIAAPDAGRLLALSHPHYVVDALTGS